MKSFYLLTISTISCLGILVYSATFLDTFHFDDFTYIVGNDSIRNIHNLYGIWSYYPCRFVTFLTLALNYRFHQLDVFGYHLFNLAVHLGSAILVWWLVLLTFSTPVMKEEKITRHADVIALFAGLVFVSHPVQIEAVTYICQRAASMAAFFYLASLCLYVKSRLLRDSVIANPKDEAILYTGSLLMAMMAMFTKEIAITLPLMIVLYEFYFFETKKSMNWKRFFPFFLTLLSIPLTMLLTRSKFFHEIQSIAQGPEGISPMHYFLTQIRVIVTYLRLSFFPFYQNFDYDYPIFKNILELPVLTSLLLLIIILFFAKRLFSKYRLVSFSILWFFLTLLPESSFLPEKDVIFEHRLYLPLAGFSIFLVSSIYYLLGKKSVKTMVILLAMFVACFSILTFQRNKIWKNEFTLWNDSVHKSPHKARAYMSRGSEYFQQNRFDLAMSDYNKALELNPAFMIVYIDRAVIYSKQGKLNEAIRDLNKAVEINPTREEPYFNLGNFYADQGNYRQAILEFSKAIEINPVRAQSYKCRGDIYVKKGDYAQAITDYDRAIEIDPSCAEAYNNRGSVYARQGHYARAVLDYTQAIDINPNFEDAITNLRNARFKQDSFALGVSDKEYFNRGAASFRKGNFTEAITDFTAAININPDFAQAYNDRGFAYLNQSKLDQAISDYDKAIEIDPNYADAFYNRGIAYEYQMNLTKAISDYDRTIAINPAYAHAYNNRAHIYIEENDFTKAISDYDKIIEMDPGYAQAYSNEAIIYFRLNEYKKAWDNVHKAEKSGAVVNPQFISALKKASGRE